MLVDVEYTTVSVMYVFLNYTSQEDVHRKLVELFEWIELPHCLDEFVQFVETVDLTSQKKVSKKLEVIA